MAHKAYQSIDQQHTTVAINYLLQPPVTKIAASGAIDPHTPAVYAITNAGVTALTLAAPTAGAQSAGGDDGVEIEIRSTTAFAHTLTATGLLQTGTANVNVGTFSAFAGAGIWLLAYNGKWIVKSAPQVTFT
jgi:hypothetical protein